MTAPRVEGLPYRAEPADPTIVKAGGLKTVNGNSLAGVGDIAVSGDPAEAIHAAAAKATPVDADEFGLVDSAASNVLKKTLWSQIKATLKTYFDTLYPRPSQTGNSGKFLTTNGTAESWATVSAGGGTWGTIAGTLSDQADLQASLNAKLASTFTKAQLDTAISDGNGVYVGDSLIVNNPGSGIANDNTNYERGYGKWVGNVFEFGTQYGGTGTPRSMAFKANYDFSFNAPLILYPTQGIAGNVTIGSGDLVVSTSGFGVKFGGASYPKIDVDPTTLDMRLEAYGVTTMRVNAGCASMNSTIDGAIGFLFSAGAPSFKGLVVRALASQTGNLFEAQDLYTRNMVAVSANGTLIVDGDTTANLLDCKIGGVSRVSVNQYGVLNCIGTTANFSGGQVALNGSGLLSNLPIQVRSNFGGGYHSSNNGGSSTTATLSEYADGVWQFGTTVNNDNGSLRLTNLTALGNVSAMGNLTLATDSGYVGSPTNVTVKMGPYNSGIFESYAILSILCNGSVPVQVNGVGVRLADNVILSWCNGPAYGYSSDVGFGRVSAGLVELNNGTMVASGGTYADLRLKKLTSFTSGDSDQLTLTNTTYGRSIRFGWESGGATPHINCDDSLRMRASNTIDILPNSVTYGITYGVTAVASERTIYNQVGDLVIKAVGATHVPAVVRGAASQTGNLQEWQDSSSTVLASVGPGGNITMTNDAVIGRPGTALGMSFKDYVYSAYINTNYALYIFGPYDAIFYSTFTHNGKHTNQANGAASVSALALTGTMYSGASAKPHVLIEPTGTTAGTWSAAGTALGVNLPSGSTANFLDFKVAGDSTSALRVDATGNIFVSYLGSLFCPNMQYDLSYNYYLLNANGLRLHSGGSLAFWGGASVLGTQECGVTRNSAGVINIDSSTIGNGLGSLVLANLDASGSAKLGVATVATLPSASANAYREMNVSDALAPVMGSTVVTGGAVKTKVRSNGTSWTVCGI